VADRVPEAQKAVVARLKAHTGTNAIIAGRVYDRPPQDVVFPYVSLGPVTAIPFDAQGLRGSDMLFTLHLWTRTPGAIGMRLLAAQVYAALHWHALTLDAGTAVMCRINGRREITDPDGITSHGMLDLQILTDG
jgi:hypothetical protein